MFISNNRASCHLWWKENLVKHQKVSKNMKIIVGLNCRYIFNCPITIIFVRIGPYNNLKKVLVLRSLDLWSLNLYGITNVFHYWHWTWHWNTLPYINSYFITSKLYTRPSNTNTMNNYPIRNNNNNNNNNDFDNNISKYY